MLRDKKARDFEKFDIKRKGINGRAYVITAPDLV